MYGAELGFTTTGGVLCIGSWESSAGRSDQIVGAPALAAGTRTGTVGATAGVPVSLTLSSDSASSSEVGSPQGWFFVSILMYRVVCVSNSCVPC